jgi:hypothetical protein
MKIEKVFAVDAVHLSSSIKRAKNTRACDNRILLVYTTHQPVFFALHKEKPLHKIHLQPFYDKGKTDMLFIL